MNPATNPATNPVRQQPNAQAASVRHVLVHLITPLLMCIGMGLAYMSAFMVPHPHHVKVAVIGQGPQVAAVAQAIQSKAGDTLTVSTLPSTDAAVSRLHSRDLVGAFVPDPAKPQLYIAEGNSDSSATVAAKVFTTVAALENKPLAVTDVAPTTADDPTNSGPFFLMIAVSIGSYSAVAAIGAGATGWSLKRKTALALGTATAVSLIGAALAGPVFHLAHHSLAGVWALAWLYSAAILLIGVGLHPFLKRWTTLVMMVLFVMLNFTSSGGLFQPELQDGFFGGLHAFWNGAGLVEGVRSLLYFGGTGLARHAWTLLGWVGVGALTVGAAALAERRNRVSESETEAEAEAELEELVAV
ncbi:hypothetical protein [Catenulispora pinisilvae]|uniref:hypothetical protein n=1 Tax=Catenulispora pinisilvae TaxID=2705253 RepID=UPI0018923831|nr:hypothetical protein [Catenulispora pinisilvae]